jgi:hypothetical protein
MADRRAEEAAQEGDEASTKRRWDQGHARSSADDRGQINEVTGTRWSTPTPAEGRRQRGSTKSSTSRSRTSTSSGSRAPRPPRARRPEDRGPVLAQDRRAIEEEKKRKLEHMKRGDELPSGVLEMVKVYVATKRHAVVGDKMAGRHGNKGVIARSCPKRTCRSSRTARRWTSAEPAGRAQPYERRPDPRDAPGLGGEGAGLPGGHAGLRRRHRGRDPRRRSKRPTSNDER